MEKVLENLDLESIEGIFKTYYKSLCNIVFRIVRDKEAAEDVVQEMFLKIWKKRNEITIETSLKSYLFRAASNAAINYLHAEKRNKIKETLSLKETANSNVDESYKFNETELESLINQALNNLPPKCKAIFLLSRLEGLKYQEIAERLCISIKTVENQMGIALKKLREELQPYYNNKVLVLSTIFIYINFLS